MLTSSGLQPTELADGERWFVVFTLPHQEKRAQTQLENQSYRTFLPKREKTVRHARKLTTVVAPFFPRYMFIILDPEHDQWRPVPEERATQSAQLRSWGVADPPR